MTEPVKRCSRCRIWKPLSQYYNATKGPQGKDGYCKKCRHEVTKAYTNKMTPEQLARRADQKTEHFMRKYGMPYEPHEHRKERRNLAKDAASNLSSSSDVS